MNYIKNLLDIKNKYIRSLVIFLILIASSFLIMTITFVFATSIFVIGSPLFRSYFKSGLLLLMNFIPIFLFMVIIYLLSNRLWLSFLSSGTLFVTFSIINKFKLTYRDDPFTFIDIKLIKESMGMVDRYEIKLSPNMIVLIIGLIIATILLKVLFDYRVESKKVRFSLLMITLLIGVIAFGKPYFNEEVYNKVGDKSLINIYSEPQQFRSKGFVYPFIYSITTAKVAVLEGYDESKAIDTLSKYDYKDIPEHKKVNVIAIMLEAYNDFSIFENVKFGIDPYTNFHKIQSESVQGKLVTNIFAGNTIQTERSFLTGFNNHREYYTNTNSFVWYLKEQGYRTEAMHPIYGWFYNRRNVNTFLGFDSFYYYENKYVQIQEAFYDDLEFFDFIIEGYEKSRDNNKPYFNFTVTYQNHGPYSNEKYSEEQFLKWQDGYDELTYNIINNYLSGIYRTDKAIKKLIDYYESEKEPTIVVFFGDHNPWLGQDAVGYEMLGIDLDFSSEEGFRNYYETPYIIWGNDAAKTTLNNNLVGIGNDISPNLFMIELFQIFGWEGNEFTQYLMEYKEHIQVNNNAYFKESGEYTTTLSPEGEDLYNDFLNIEFYNSQNFRKIDQ
ncbi:alkaline phosphatase family protein [Tissierella sp. Yu-01]|uniref:LTA synthase family protein n=1 Tax=Tissierella sp. Yu-01 TaxID=3035694 RepID=UPI00240DBB9F|nr:alkaline phosphatase family protein [Tissierella sp. Yu-01]WFA07709.1 sulfatase-like hydrolase/transferase [Tissierella sp. Yu-01]